MAPLRGLALAALAALPAALASSPSAPPSAAPNLPAALSYAATFTGLATADLNVSALPDNLAWVAKVEHIPKLVANESLDIGVRVVISFFKQMSEQTAFAELAKARAFVSSRLPANSTLLEELELWAVPRLDAVLTSYLGPNFNQLKIMTNTTTPVQFTLRALILALGLLEVIKDQTSLLTLRLNRFSLLTPSEKWNLKGFLPWTASAPTSSGSGLHATLSDAIKQELAQAQQQAQSQQQGQSWPLPQTTQPTSQPSAYADSYSLVGTAVGAVQDQGSCGSCYSFAAAAVLEGALVVQTALKNITVLSEQQIISCSTNLGCGGGNFMQAWNYSASLPNGGLAAQTVYPYSSTLGGTAAACDAAAASQGAVTTTPGNPYKASMGYVSINNDNDLLQALLLYGPVAIAIATPNCFQSYSSGVLTTSNCACCVGPTYSPTCNIDHAVTVTGWGVASDGTPYWQVQNSWGASWGQDGYVWLERGVAYPGMCGMYSQAATVEVAMVSTQCNVTTPPPFCVAAISDAPTTPPSSSSNSLPAWVIVLIAFGSFFGALILVYLLRWLPTSKYNVFAPRDDYTPIPGPPATHEE